MEFDLAVLAYVPLSCLLLCSLWVVVGGMPLDNMLIELELLVEQPFWMAEPLVLELLQFGGLLSSQYTLLLAAVEMVVAVQMLPGAVGWAVAAVFAVAAAAPVAAIVEFGCPGCSPPSPPPLS